MEPSISLPSFVIRFPLTFERQPKFTFRYNFSFENSRSRLVKAIKKTCVLLLSSRIVFGESYKNSKKKKTTWQIAKQLQFRTKRRTKKKEDKRKKRMQCNTLNAIPLH